MPFLLKQDVGADMRREITFYSSRPLSSQGHGILGELKKKEVGAKVVWKRVKTWVVSGLTTI